MHCARGGQLERRPSANGVTPSRGGGSEATEHGVAACHLRGELETETHGLPFTDWLATDLLQSASKPATYRAFPGHGTLSVPNSTLDEVRKQTPQSDLSVSGSIGN